MGQQPNIEIDRARAPRSSPEPGTPGRWSPDRPGEIDGPDQMAWGGVFGRPGPDTGYALRLIRRAEFDRSGGPVEEVVATLVGARGSLFGRAPTPKDVEVALTLLGFRPDGLPAEVVDRLADRRQAGLRAAAHEIRKGTALLAEVPVDQLAAEPDELRRLLAAG